VIRTLDRCIEVEPHRLVRQRHCQRQDLVHAAITQAWSNGQVEAQITNAQARETADVGRRQSLSSQTRLIGAP
jgi:transposase